MEFTVIARPKPRVVPCTTVTVNVTVFPSFHPNAVVLGCALSPHSHIDTNEIGVPDDVLEREKIAVGSTITLDRFGKLLKVNGALKQVESVIDPLDQLVHDYKKMAAEVKQYREYFRLQQALNVLVASEK